jgi:hypothetical protein
VANLNFAGQAASIGGLFVRLAFPIGQYFWRYPYLTLVS